MQKETALLRQPLSVFLYQINVVHVHDHCGHNGCFFVCYNYDSCVCRNVFLHDNYFCKQLLEEVSV